MATIKVPTSFNIEVEFDIPEFYRRLLSFIIDVVIQFLYLRVAVEVISQLAPNVDDDDLGSVFLIILLPVFLYHVSQEILMNGQSFGKKIMGIRVLHENGGRPSVDQFFIRWLLRISDTWIVLILLIIIYYRGQMYDTESAFVILLALAFLITDIVLVIASPKNQRIGDILARTILVRTHSKADITETVFQDVAENYTPVFPSVMRLSDRDLNAIKGILESARKAGDYQMAESASLKIRNHLQIHTDMPAFDFLDTLLKDYNYLSVK